MEKHDKSKSPTGWASFKRALRYGALICFTLLFVGYLCICFSIRSSVKEISAKAVQEYPGDRIEALMTYVESANHNLRQRNRAVWALGQIGDSRALPVLEKFRTGKPCDHDSTLCQGELRKAIKACKGSFNATAWLPR
jgi:HEAT repeat protein